MTVLLRGKKTPTQRAIAVLRKFGQDAHVYLPGVGMLNGLQAGNYLDSSGTTAATVDQPVGLVLDAAGGLGVELVTVPTVAAVPIGGPEFTSYAVGPATVAGKTYSVSFTVSDHSGTGSVSLDGGTGQWVVNPTATGDTSLAGNGTKNFIIQCANPAAIRVFSRSTNTCTFSNISVREVTGIAASQTTTASKPILRRDAGGRYYWQFDGTNDSLSLGGPLFQMADDHCVIAGFASTAPSGDRYAFDVGHSTNSNPLIATLGLNGTSPKVYWRDNAGVTTSLSGGTLPQGATGVITARKAAGVGVLKLNGTQVGTAAITAGATTVTGAAIGVRVFGSGSAAGSIYPVIAIKGTVSDPDLLLLEKLVGQLSGVTI